MISLDEWPLKIKMPRAEKKKTQRGMDFVGLVLRLVLVAVFFYFVRVLPRWIGYKSPDQYAHEFHRKGCALVKDGNYDEAIVELTRALALTKDPKMASMILDTRAAAYASKGEKALAKEDHDRAKLMDRSLYRQAALSTASSESESTESSPSQSEENSKPATTTRARKGKSKIDS